MIESKRIARNTDYQIVKNFAVKEYDDMLQLIKDVSKYAFFLLSAFLIPVLFKINCILGLWLDKVPNQTGIFTCIVLITLMIRVIARPVIKGTHATGHIKRLDLYAGGLGLMPLPVIYVLYKLGMPAVSAFIIILIWGIFANIAEIIVFKLEMKEFCVKDYVLSAYTSCVFVAAIVAGEDYFMSSFIKDNFLDFCLYYVVAVLFNCFIVFFLGLTKNQRVNIKALVLAKIEK